MVVVWPTASKAWLLGLQVGERLGPLFQPKQGDRGSDPRRLGILAFEAVRTMSRLISLYRALSEAEVHSLISGTVCSQGVAYLNSADKGALLRLACAEMVDDLDIAAAAVARLGSRCGGVWPRGFEFVYADLKAGTEDMSHLVLGFHPKDVDRKMKKMEKYVASTSTLYAAMEDLAELETWGMRRLGKSENLTESSFESFRKRLSQTRNRVRQLREESLWSRSFEKVAELMARSIVSVFARLCAVYRPFVPELPDVVLDRQGRVKFFAHYPSRLCYPAYHSKHPGGIYSSGPLERPYVGNLHMRNSGPLLRTTEKDASVDRSWKERALEPPENTLGATGMALRCAEVVVFLEKLAVSPELVAEESRDELYRKLPKGLRGAVMAKLRSHSKLDDGFGPSDALASGWREAVDGILSWLAPIARDTVRWQSERSLEKRQISSEPKVLMMQTLIFSDREKAEAAIVELLVAFSYVCRYS